MACLFYNSSFDFCGRLRKTKKCFTGTQDYPFLFTVYFELIQQTLFYHFSYEKSENHQNTNSPKERYHASPAIRLRCKRRKGIEGEGEKISTNAEHVREEGGRPLLFPLASRTSNYLLSLNPPLPPLSALATGRLMRDLVLNLCHFDFFFSCYNNYHFFTCKLFYFIVFFTTLTRTRTRDPRLFVVKRDPRQLPTLNKFTQFCLLVTHAITYFLLSLY